MRFAEFLTRLIADNPGVIYRNKEVRFRDLPAKAAMGVIKGRWEQVERAEGEESAA